MAFNNYRPDVAIVRDVGTLTHEQVQGLAAIGLLEDTNMSGLASDHADLQVYVGAYTDWNYVPAEVASHALAIEVNCGFSESDVVFSTVEQLIEALSPTKQGTTMDDVTAPTLNMPLSVLEPELTAAHREQLSKLGYQDVTGKTTWYSTADGAGALLLTDNDHASDRGKIYSTNGKPSVIQSMFDIHGQGTIFSTVDDLIAALQPTKH